MARSRLGRRWSVYCLALLVGVGAAGVSRAQYGPVFTGAGPVNLSVAGVATAMPLSPAGAMYWNPATLTGLGGTTLETGAELLSPDTSVTSTVPANGFGPGVPPVFLTGKQNSDSTWYPLPTIALAYTPEGSDFSFGLGIFAVAGFGVDYAGATVTPPLLTAPPPNGIGFGPIYSDLEVLQITTAVAYRLTDRLSVSVGPTLDIASLKGDPAIFAAPDNASGNGFPTFPNGTHGRNVFGGGFIVGAYYHEDTWGVGASFKSPQWFDKFRFNSTDQLGRPREIGLNADLPMIVSLGASYTGLERWIFGIDAHYIDFKDTNFLGESGFGPGGAVRGLGWDSVFSVAIGAQYQLSDTLSLRMGYSWGANPIPNSQSMINTVSPVVVQNVVYAGASWNVTEAFALTVAYVHGFENSITGPAITAAGPVPGTSVRNSAEADAILIGVTMKLGGGCSTTPVVVPGQGG